MNFIDYMPYIGYFFILYYLSQYANVLKYIKQKTISNEEVTSLFGEERVEETKEEVPKIEIKFEDKYLAAFKSFSSDYFFTEDELTLKNNKFNELKSEYQINKNKEFDNLNALLLETHKLINLGHIITEEVKNLLIKYFEIEDDYADDPSNVDFDELYIYLENDHKKFQEEIDKLLEELKNEEVLDAEFKNKALDFILNKKLDGFINNYILEFTPLGNVYMRYNNFKKSFEYFSNNTIPYRYLETIGRKYVMTFKCKALFIDLEEELKKASVLALEKEKEKEKEKEQSTNNSVSKFKSYNKDIKMDKLYAKGRPSQNVLPPQIKANLPNVNTSSEKQLLKENANRYTWEGRLSNMQLLKKVDRKVIDKNYAMTFSDFKQIKK
jgi:DNA-binding protein H-NS